MKILLYLYKALYDIFNLVRNMDNSELYRSVCRLRIEHAKLKKHLAFENSDYKKYDDYMREHYFWKHVEEYWRSKLLSSLSVLSMKSILQKDAQQLSAYYANHPEALMPDVYASSSMHNEIKQ